jgi:hypothetical protein
MIDERRDLMRRLAAGIAHRRDSDATPVVGDASTAQNTAARSNDQTAPVEPCLVGCDDVYAAKPRLRILAAYPQTALICPTILTEARHPL